VDEAGACVAESRHVLEGVTLALVHDFAVTENYYVIILGSMEVRKTVFVHLLTLKCSMQHIDWISDYAIASLPVHDFSRTAHSIHTITTIPPLKVDIVSFLTEYMIGQCSVAQCLKYNEKVPSRASLDVLVQMHNCDAF